ncbi:hypothetical protein HQO42_05340 [Rhodococcus fascians]|nr:hypothetical protein [Rhodococcus fascians]MBY4236571.1 hypothetical protein [Rhodococcus fascians]MBY4252063.1 hypothetical protein [Rhodococcus fascians]MBY4267916.1 hypothetical protein [Rhodococcus fascians]
MTPFVVQVIVAFIALGSLALGVYNFIHAKGEPVRAKQRVLREEVRTCVDALLPVVKDAQQRIRVGTDFGDTVPPVVLDCRDRIAGLEPRLTHDRLKMQAGGVGHQAVLIHLAWEAVAENRYSLGSPEAQRKRTASELDLRDQLEKVRPLIDKLVATLDQFDRGELT